MCCRTRSTPAVLQTCQFTLGGFSVSPATGRKVFRRKFRGKHCCKDVPLQPAAAAAAAKDSASMLSSAAPHEHLTAVLVSAVVGNKDTAAAPVSICDKAAAEPASHTPSADLAAAAVRQDAQQLAGAVDCRQHGKCSAASPLAGAGGVPATGPEAAAGLSTRPSTGVASSHHSIKPAAISAQPAARLCQRRRRSCPPHYMMLRRRRLLTTVLQPHAAPPLIVHGQPGQQQQQFQQQTTNSDVCSQAAGMVPGCFVSTACQRVPVPAAEGSPCRIKPTLCWCNLGSKVRSPSPLLSPGAVLAATAAAANTVGEPWQESGGSFGALLQSRTQASCKNGQEKQGADGPAMAQVGIESAEVIKVGLGIMTVPNVDSNRSCVQRQSSSCRIGPHQQHLSQHLDDSSPEGLIRQCSARSADAELDHLIASGAFDHLLGLH